MKKLILLTKLRTAIALVPVRTENPQQQVVRKGILVNVIMVIVMTMVMRVLVTMTMMMVMGWDEWSQGRVR